jgi:hypothetical protein
MDLVSGGIGHSKIRDLRTCGSGTLHVMHVFRLSPTAFQFLQCHQVAGP